MHIIIRGYKHELFVKIIHSQITYFYSKTNKYQLILCNDTVNHK